MAVVGLLERKRCRACAMLQECDTLMTVVVCRRRQFMFATEQTDRFDESGGCRDQSARGLGAELAQPRDAVGLAGSCIRPVLPEHCVFGLRMCRLDGLTGSPRPSNFPAKI